MTPTIPVKAKGAQQCASLYCGCGCGTVLVSATADSSCGGPWFLNRDVVPRLLEGLAQRWRGE